MTITISANAYWEILLETQDTIRLYDPSDSLDILWQYPRQLGEGQSRFIEFYDLTRTIVFRAAKSNFCRPGNNFCRDVSVFRAAKSNFCRLGSNFCRDVSVFRAAKSNFCRLGSNFCRDVFVFCAAKSNFCLDVCFRRLQVIFFTKFNNFTYDNLGNNCPL